MKTLTLWALLMSFTGLTAYAQEKFSTKRVVNDNTATGRLRHPFAMVLGPDDSLWITERRGYVIRMNRVNGGKTELLNIRNKVKFTTSGATGIKQDGMLGIALHPDLFLTGKNFVYLAYTYDSLGLRRIKIVRYTYQRDLALLTNELTLVSGIPGSNDHNGGKLAIGNFGSVGEPDYKLVYSCGDGGANQFGNSCDSIQSQYIPTSTQIASGNKVRYSGKILRINLDGTIPADNPDFSGIGRSHVWSVGHRNPQGLVFERDMNNQLIPGGRLYSSEHGPASDDEVNVIYGGGNYGWPRVAGKLDNNWYKYYQWSNNSGCSSYPGECSSTQTTYGIAEGAFFISGHVNPIFDLYPTTPPGGAACNWLKNPTVAPSSLIVYPFNNRIPGWENSLLMPTLKAGAVFRLKLNASRDGSLSVSDSVIPYFKETALNRYRDMVVANDGITFYLLTDSVGATSGPIPGVDGGITDRGCVLEYVYTGSLMALGDDDHPLLDPRLYFRIYPSPATDYVHVQSKRNVSKPIFFKLLDSGGRIILTGKQNRDEFKIDVSKFHPGLYIIQLFNGRDVLEISKKIIVL